MEDTFLPYSDDDGISFVDGKIIEIILQEHLVVLVGDGLNRKG